MKTKYYVMFILASIIFTGCGLLFNSKDILVSIDEETKEYCLFEMGSYWIYQDSATLEYDSIFILNTVEKHPENAQNMRTGKSTYEFEEIWMYGYIAGAYDTLRQFYMRITTAFEENGTNTNHIAKPTLCLLNYEGMSSVYYHNGTIGEQYLGIYFMDSISEIYLNDNVYFYVKQFEEIEPTNVKTYYISKNVGLIRIETQDGEQRTVKNLIRYNIVQHNQNN
ncbi:hypothetical protein FACS1894178_1860 [Bacteroidia bacterium]|nr:hypothetical protein FACS1894178_1860 [Bacteroidia bacterium]